MNTPPNLSNEYLRSLNDQELKTIIIKTFQLGDELMITDNINEIKEKQYIGTVSSALILLCIYKIQQAKTNEELSKLFIINNILIY
jgi:hypothetical protein